MTGFERRKEQSREKILTAAEALFTRHGFNKISMNEIARKAGVSKVTIYHLFDSKERLIRSCVNIFGNRIMDNIRGITEADTPFPDKLKELLNFLMEVSQSNAGNAYIELQSDPRLKYTIEDLSEKITGLFVEFIREGQRQDYLNAALSEEAIKTHIEIFTQGIAANPELHARVQGNRALAHDLFIILLYGLAKIR